PSSQCLLSRRERPTTAPGSPIRRQCSPEENRNRSSMLSYNNSHQAIDHCSLWEFSSQIMSPLQDSSLRKFKSSFGEGGRVSSEADALRSSVEAFPLVRPRHPELKCCSPFLFVTDIQSTHSGTTPSTVL